MISERKNRAIFDYLEGVGYFDPVGAYQLLRRLNGLHQLNKYTRIEVVQSYHVTVHFESSDRREIYYKTARLVPELGLKSAFWRWWSSFRKQPRNKGWGPVALAPFVFENNTLTLQSYGLHDRIIHCVYEPRQDVLYALELTKY